MARAPRILGPDGRPVRPERGELVERTAGPSGVVGLRRAQQWRSVVTDLDPPRLRSILRNVAAGVWCPDYFELAEEIEERYLHYRGVLQQRRLAAAAAVLDVFPASDAARDRALADEVRARILNAPGWHDALLDLLDALGKGVSCQEIVWAFRGGRWTPAALHRVDPRWLVLDPADGETPYLLGDGGEGGADRLAGTAPGPWGRQARPLAPGKFVFHRHRSKSGLAGRGGLAYAVSTLWLLLSVAVRDWWAFGEVFGIPLRIGRYGPEASDDDIRALEEAVALLASDAGCVVPESVLIDLVQAKGSVTGAEGFFERQADWVDAQVSKAVVGQTMTSDDGASLAQARVHQEVRGDIVADDVRQMCDTLNRTVVAWYCELNHPPRAAGWPRIAPPPDEDALDTAGLARMVQAGLRVPASWARERMGIPEPAEGEETLGGPPAGGPGARPPRTGLHAAEDPLEGAPWLALSGGLTRPVADLLDRARSPEEFLARAAALDAPEDLARDLAERCFHARLEGETEFGAVDGEAEEG